MRIKTDFVTNSSSTGWIVSVPREFYPDQEKIIEVFKDHNLDFDDSEEWGETRILQDFDECLEILKNGDNLWYYGDDGTDSRIFYTMAEICEQNGFLLAVFEIGGEGNNRIEGIVEEKMNKWFMDTQLQKLNIEVKNEPN